VRHHGWIILVITYSLLTMTTGQSSLNRLNLGASMTRLGSTHVVTSSLSYNFVLHLPDKNTTRHNDSIRVCGKYHHHRPIYICHSKQSTRNIGKFCFMATQKVVSYINAYYFITIILNCKQKTLFLYTIFFFSVNYIYFHLLNSTDYTQSMMCNNVLCEM